MNSENSFIINAIKEAAQILYQYEQASQSLRHILRDYFGEHSLDDNLAEKIQSMVIGVIRYQNTIDFILSRCIIHSLQKEIPLLDKILLRITLYESRWLSTPINVLQNTIGVKFLNVLKNANEFNLISAVKSKKQDEKLSILFSHPTFLVQQLTKNLGYEETISLLNKNNSNSKSYLRVNQLVDDSENILSSLLDKGVELEKDPDVNFLYSIKQGLNLIIKTDEFKTGKIFVQDKASILVVKTLNPKPDEYVWDACAAPGMKTHLIWEYMQGRGLLFASDINQFRLLSSQKRFKVLNNQIEWGIADASSSRFKGINKILIDAPCTSTGILQSHPSYKWRLNKKILFEIMTIQNKILDGIISKYSDSPGTEILYSTCSILPHEGESQIDSILEKHNNIELLEGLPIGNKGYPGFKCSNKIRRFFPHIHETNGFFIAHLKIKN